VLVFDHGAGSWFVDEVRGGSGHVRFSLDDFEHTETGRCLADKIRGAVEAAAIDA
jgi:hypothetical protein